MNTSPVTLSLLSASTSVSAVTSGYPIASNPFLPVISSSSAITPTVSSIRTVVLSKDPLAVDFTDAIKAATTFIATQTQNAADPTSSPASGPNFHVPSGAIVGIVIGILTISAVVGGLLYWLGRRQGRMRIQNGSNKDDWNRQPELEATSRVQSVRELSDNQINELSDDRVHELAGKQGSIHSLEITNDTVARSMRRQPDYSIYIGQMTRKCSDVE